MDELQGPDRPNEGLISNVTRQVKGALNSTAEWVGLKSTPSDKVEGGVEDFKDAGVQAKDEGKGILQQGKETLQSGIQSAKETIGLNPTPSEKAKAGMEEIHDGVVDKTEDLKGTDRPVDEGMLSKASRQVQGALNSTAEWVGLKSTPSDRVKGGLESFKDAGVQGKDEALGKTTWDKTKETVQDEIDSTKESLGMKPTVSDKVQDGAVKFKEAGQQKVDELATRNDRGEFSSYPEHVKRIEH